MATTKRDKLRDDIIETLEVHLSPNAVRDIEASDDLEHFLEVAAGYELKRAKEEWA